MLNVAIALFALAGPPAAAAAVPVQRAARVDTAALVAAAWRAASAGHAGRRATALAPWPDDATPAPAWAAGLRARGVPVRATAGAVGPDTVVYRVRPLAPGPRGAVRVTLHSAWTTRLAACTARSTNVEVIAVACARGRCRGERVGGVAHGDDPCLRAASARGLPAGAGAPAP